MEIMRRLLSLRTIYVLAAILPAGTVSAEPIVLDGLIEPSLIVNVGSSVAGILETVKAERGDVVRKGKVLATLQSGVEQATLELARARAQMESTIKVSQERVEYAKRQVKRTEELYNKQAVPFSQMDEVQTNRILAGLELQEALENQRLAQLELKRSEEIVNRMSVRSPINGVVAERFLSKGEFVEDQPILKIAQINPLHVEVIAPVEMLGAVRVGMRAEVRPENPVGGGYPVKVTIVDRVIDAASGTFGIRLELPNRDYHLPAGLKCKVVFFEK
jgi:RND family efflux transporter MFP subunit